MRLAAQLIYVVIAAALGPGFKGVAGHQITNPRRTSGGVGGYSRRETARTLASFGGTSLVGGGPVAKEGDYSDEHDSQHYDSPSTVSVAIALMLMGMTAVVMSLFYLVNYPDEELQDVTWYCLSSTMSLFCAVLLFTASKSVMVTLFNEDPMDHHGAPDVFTMLLSLVRFLIVYLIDQVILIVLENTTLLLKAWAHIGSHISGFAAIEFFGGLLDFAFADNCFMGACGVVVASVSIAVLCWLARHFRNLFIATNNQNSQFFGTMCVDAEFVFSSLTIGLLISMFARQCITGTMPPIHGSPMHKTPMQIWMLFGVAWACELTLVVCTIWRHSDARMRERGFSDVFIYASRGFLKITSMSAGWLFLHWGQWLFWSKAPDSVGESDKMIARTVMALIFSMSSFVSFFILDALADSWTIGQRGLRGIISSFALLLGLGWESVFSCAIESVSAMFLSKPGMKIATDVGFSLFLCVVVLPAWVLFILPKAPDEELDDDEYLDRECSKTEAARHPSARVS